MKATFAKILNKFGYDIFKVANHDLSNGPYSNIKLNCTHAIVDLEALAHLSLSIPGMISARSGQILYTLCYMQNIEGDVVEIGSWQGRSSSFLARAVKNSANGRFYAIDHFKGNVGKEKSYIAGKADLTDLKGIFLSNMRRLDLIESVHLLDMPNVQAAQELQDARIRFLFIDGDHSREGVEKDIELFFPNLVEGAIIVFDDFSETFPGLIEAVDVLLSRNEFSRVMSYQNTLVLTHKRNNVNQ